MRIYVQLGILKDIFDWIYDNILSPVFKFIGDLLGTIFETLFNNLLMPLLEMELNVIIEIVGTMVMNFLYNLLFQVARLLLWVLDAVERIFRTLAGLEPVYFTGDSGVKEESGSLLLTMLNTRTIRSALLGMILASVALCFLIAIFATIRAAGDMSGKRSVSEVLHRTGRSLVKLITIPFMALVIVATGDAVLLGINNATAQDQVPVSQILFTMSTLDAVREEDFPDAKYYNVSTRSSALAKKNAPDPSTVADFGMKDKYRRQLYYGELDRDNIREVLRIFDIRRIDYIICVGLTAVFIFLFGVMAVNMASRIFDCLLLLLVEPFFAAAIPLDEGKKFDKWKELFLGRLISGYGIIVGVNLYLSVIGLIFSGKIQFFGPKTTPAVEYLVEIFFVAIGAWTIYKAGPVVTGIMSAQAGVREASVSAQSQQITAQTAAFLTSPIRRIAGAAVQGGWEAMKQGLSRLTDGSLGGTGGGGSVAPAGTGAFGQMTGTGPTGVHFNGKWSVGGMTPVSGVHFGTKAGTLGSARGELTGLHGAQTAGTGDELDTLLGIGGRGPLDANGFVGGDEMETIFDVGGSSLFNEGDAGMSAAFTGGGGIGRPVSHPPGGLAAPYRSQADAADEYVWIGQRDQQEREERKKREEELRAQAQKSATDAAESSTGMDLDGDGKVSDK